jgi:steroid delta-isomerase-like uncharacterized protein
MGNNKQLVRRHFDEVWTQGQLDTIKQIYDDGYQAFLPLIGKIDRDGLKGVVSAYRRAFPDLKFEVVEVVHEGDRVAARWTASGTSQGEFMGIPATHKRGVVDGLSLFEIKNGKIVRDSSEMDVVAFFQQMGLQLPVKAQATMPEMAMQH